MTNQIKYGSYGFLALMMATQMSLLPKEIPAKMGAKHPIKKVSK